MHLSTSAVRSFQNLACAIVSGFVLISSVAASEPLLFSAPQATELAEGVEPNSHRARPVLLDTEAFEAALQSDGEPVSLQLFDDVRVELLFDRVSYYSRTTTAFTGRLGDGQDPAAWYSLVRNGDAYLGHFWTGDGKVYKLRPIDEESGLHAVLELDSEGFGPCLTCEQDHGSIAQPMPPAQVVQGNARGCEDDGSIIDVLIVYTPSARNAAGGTNSIQALAISAIEVSNQAYINSGIQTSLRLTLATEVDYSESGSMGTDLANLRNNVVPGVHELRDETKSDLVAMLSTSSGACGIGYLLQSLNPGFESNGFSVTNYSCAVGNLTFPHELGHNMGCQHDIDNAGSNSIFPYSYGWRWTTNGGQLRRSVMAYSPGSRVPHFSNPEVFNGGQPTGVQSSANNALTINNTAYLISNFRVSDCNPEPEDCGWSAVGEGVTGTVFALTEHNDGSGKALYVGGSFDVDGAPSIGRLARWDGQQWSEVGGGVNGTVFATASVPSGPLAGLYAAGSFSQAGGQSVSNIARWDGQQWSPVGDGLNNRVYAMTVFDDGSGPELYAAGVFTGSGGQSLSRIAKWDGAEWRPVGTGLNGLINALEVFDDGTGEALYAAGLIVSAGGEPVTNIARWDGQSWAAVGAQDPDDTINALEVFDDGTGEALYAAGRFMSAGGESTPGIARWDGLNWSPVGDGLDSEVFSLLAFRDDQGPALFALGSFVLTIDFAPVAGIAKWDGQLWQRMGLGIGGAGGRTLATASLGPGPSMFIGGSFSTAGGVQSSSIASWSCQSVRCPQDVDGDGAVSLGDLNLVLAGFGQETSEGDTNGDGVVNLADLNAVLASFGESCL